MPDHDGIEVYYDDKQRLLKLRCEPDAFASFRELAREYVNDLPEVALDDAIEIHLTDTAAFIARRDAPRRRKRDSLFSIMFVTVIGLAVFGFYSLLKILF